MDAFSKLTKKDWEKILKKTTKDTLKDFIYAYGQSRETTKKLYETSNIFLLIELKQIYKDGETKERNIKQLSKTLMIQEFRFILLYILTFFKFLVLTLIFGGFLFLLSKQLDSFHKYIQDFVFSVIMILYSACLYRFIGDEFKTILYSKDCFKYTKRKFKPKLKAVKFNLQYKKMLNNGFFDKNENFKQQLIANIKRNDIQIESWEKL